MPLTRANPLIFTALASVFISILLVLGVYSADTAQSDAALPAGVAPPNDNFESPAQIDALPFEDSVDITNATLQQDEPEGCGSASHTVWYEFTPDQSIQIKAEITQSDFPTAVALYEGDDLDSLTRLRCDEFDPGPTPPPPVLKSTSSVLEVAFLATLEGGHTYYFQAGASEEQTGQLVLEISAAINISGNLFLDLNENAVQDPGEPGVHEHAIRLTGPAGEQEDLTDHGFYSFTVPPGTYTVSTEPRLPAPALCVDSFGGFSPIRLDDCLSPLVPWAFTTSGEADIIAEPGHTYSIDFGLAQMDVAVLAGKALLQNSSAPPGAMVEAIFDGNVCGETEPFAAPAARYNYELVIFGADEVAGCPEDGDVVSFHIDGIPANETFTYEATGNHFHFQHLVAIADYAWYWAQEIALPDQGISDIDVEALIGGKVCGQAEVELRQTFSQQALGFDVLAVPSVDVEPGCGQPGSQVTFRVNGVMTGASAVWQPGTEYVDLSIPGAVKSGDMNCSNEIEAVDALLILQFLAGFDVETYCMFVARDVDCSGEAEATDALLVLRFIAALPIEIPDNCAPIGQSGP